MGGSIFSPLFLQSYAAHPSFLCKSLACSCYHHRGVAERSLLGGFRCSGPRCKLYLHKREHYGRQLDLLSSPRTPLVSASSKWRSGVWPPRGSGAWHSAFGSGNTSTPETLLPPLPRESSTQQVPVCRTLPIADIRLIYDIYTLHIYIYIRAPCSKCCWQWGAGGRNVGRGSEWGWHRCAAQHGTLHSLLSEGSSFISPAFHPGSSL